MTEIPKEDGELLKIEIRTVVNSSSKRVVICRSDLAGDERESVVTEKMSNFLVMGTVEEATRFLLLLQDCCSIFCFPICPLFDRRPALNIPSLEHSQPRIFRAQVCHIIKF